MQVHTMNLNIEAISALNPGLTPADVSDYPVYTLTKEAWFQFSEHFFFTILWCLDDYILSNAFWLLKDSSLKELVWEKFSKHDH